MLLGRSVACTGLLAAAAAMPGCLLVTPLGDKAERASASGGHGGSTSAKTGGRGGVANPADAGDETSGSFACSTNDECIRRLGVDDPFSYRCRPSDHTCTNLKTSECPLAYGEASNANALYIGAFAPLDPSRLQRNSVVWAHRLALEEISPDKVGGIPGGPGGARRPLVMIVCNSDTASVAKGLTHLADDVEVPAVLATLKPEDLQTGFEAHRARNIFYLSPVGTTSAFLSDRSDHLIWHMLGQPRDLAPVYQGLLNRAEAYARAYRGVGTRKLRVALVTSKDAFDTDLANFVVQEIRFNGMSAAENRSAGNYVGFTVDPSATGFGLDVVNFRPDIVISTAGRPFTKPGGVLETIETYWQDTHTADAGLVDRPFYILSPINAGDLNGVQQLIDGLMTGGADKIAFQRFIGVSGASAEDKTLQNEYANRLRTKFQDANPDTGNYYDAFYFLAYAMYGAGTNTPLTGSDIASGMQRLLGGPAYNVGPTIVSKVFQALDANATIELDGTLGPPNFDPTTDARIDDGSVFCFENTPQTGLTLRTEVLRYHHDTRVFTGSFPCFPDFYP